MNSSKTNIEILKSLEKRKLTAVTFVMDYLQLFFEEACFNLYVWPLIKTRDSVFNITTMGYHDVLCGQVGRSVISVREKLKDKLLIEFENYITIEVSLKEEDRGGPEAAMLQVDSGKHWTVW